MLVEIAIADSYGRGFEFVPAEHIQTYNTFDGYRCRSCGSYFESGIYTDDTQMSIGIAELLLSEDGLDIFHNPDAMAQKFIDVFKRDIRRGYAHGFYNFLLGITDGEEFMKKIRPDSRKSGAAMRAMPLGLIEDVREVQFCAEEQAEITHNTLEGRESAFASALLTHYCYHEMGNVGADGSKLYAYILSYMKDGINFTLPYYDSPGPFGYECVCAAITAVAESRTLSEVITRCISFGGDTDTVAAIATGAASVAMWIKNDIPDIMYTKLENGMYGKSFLQSLDRKLFSTYPRRIDMSLHDEEEE